VEKFNEVGIAPNCTVGRRLSGIERVEMKSERVGVEMEGKEEGEGEGEASLDEAESVSEETERDDMEFDRVTPLQ